MLTEAAKSAPTPLFCATVECFGYNIKPEPGVPIVMYYGSGASLIGRGQEGYWYNTTGNAVMHPLYWHYMVKQPLEVPAPWRECVSGSMPSDEDYKNGVAFYGETITGLVLNCTDKLTTGGGGYWAPMSAPDTADLKAYLEEKV
jgi:hypothetical protein